MSDINPKEEKRIKEYLGNKLSEGEIILFTGAGFSSEAKDKNGKNLPLSIELAKELCNLINLEYSHGESLKDIFQLAIRKKKNEVSRYLKQRLAVDPRSLDSEYKTIISQPWHKAYTINVDNLFEVAQTKFNFDRKIFCHSSNGMRQTPYSQSPKDLIVTQLHGRLEDIPDRVTFSHEQYFEKTFSDSSYSILSSEILQYPFLFLGSQLDEELFWHYIRLRKLKGSIRDFGELRPNSLLVIPKLSPVRQQLLKDYNITWIPQTRKEFCKSFLAPLKAESQKGLMKLKQLSKESEPVSIPSVSHLMSLEKELPPSKNYLLGSEPSWKDIYSHSVKRDKESEWINKISALNKKSKNPIPVFALTGTAGDGKTSIAMRMAAHITNKGETVGWIDRNSNIAPHKIVSLAENSEGMKYLFIDTPDVYGSSISPIISELALRNKKLKTIFVSVRGNKADRIFKSPLFDKSIPFEEFSTYRLTDNEINKILDLLEDKNLLGNLKGKNRAEQITVFKSKYKSDRQLIVAMIEVTSGKSFTDKIGEELEDLEGVSKQVYSLIAVATSRNHYLLREEILLGMRGNKSNNILNITEQMVRRGLLVESVRKGLKVRHRVIAQKISERLAQQNQLLRCYTCLAYIAAIKSAEQTSEQKRMRRLLKTLINHDLLFKISSETTEVQGLYESIEDFLKNDHHFWLQRGCFEMEHGCLNLAKNYLSQSQSLKGEDPLVILSMEHLNFKEAISSPNSEKSFRLAKEAYENIVRLIERRGPLDPYPYHILGTQGFRWAKERIKDPVKRKKYLEDLLVILKKGFENHKRSPEIKDIKDKVQREILNFFIKN